MKCVQVNGNIGNYIGLGFLCRYVVTELQSIAHNCIVDEGSVFKNRKMWQLAGIWVGLANEVVVKQNQYRF